MHRHHFLSHGSTFFQLYFLLSYLLCCTIVSPAKYIPSPTCRPTNAFVENEALYVQGGQFTFAGPVQQTFLIDLSVPWSTKDPAYKHLNEAGSPPTIATSTITADGKNWFMLVDSSAYLFNFQSQKWKQFMLSFTPITPGAENRTFDGLVTDPETGLIYIPNGILRRLANAMVRYNVTDNTFTSFTMQATRAPETRYYVAWSKVLRSMLFLGGAAADGQGIPFTSMNVYSPTNGWSFPSLNGTAPVGRPGACFVPAYGGTKMVLFGGEPPGNRSTGPRTDIFVLDVETWSWIQGPDVATEMGRAAPACAVSGDYFIAWGGCGFNLNGISGTLVFNLRTLSWTNNYVPPPKPTITTIAQPTANATANTTMTAPPVSATSLAASGSEPDASSGASNRRSSRTAAIVGPIMAVLAIVIAGMLFRHRGRLQRRSKNGIFSDAVDSSKQKSQDDDSLPSSRLTSSPAMHVSSCPADSKNVSDKIRGIASVKDLLTFPSAAITSVPAYPPPPVTNVYWASTSYNRGQPVRGPSAVVLKHPAPEVIPYMAGSPDMMLKHIGQQQQQQLQPREQGPSLPPSSSSTSRGQRGNPQESSYRNHNSLNYLQRFSQHPHADIVESVLDSYYDSRSVSQHPQALSPSLAPSSSTIS
ncbi:hypothetical protein EDD11_004810 [Mortierella claussenii]|nr:hypothetical protein EDD11_004810 [Mortierella claussenii]